MRDRKKKNIKEKNLQENSNCYFKFTKLKFYHFTITLTVFSFLTINSSSVLFNQVIE